MGIKALRIVAGFHGRPMCCAKPMWVHGYSAFYKREFGLMSARYICKTCNKVQRLYMDKPGVLAANQDARDAVKAA